ncbi:AMP-dependent synthetase and ligase [Syncephalis plumigaleata]|nr:AMP-dependent synthetase and ligase [Syncephalis plumigaleata]
MVIDVIFIYKSSDLEQQRVAVLCPSGYSYVVAQWAVWAAGGVFVPLCVQHPTTELAYHIYNAECSMAIVHPTFHDRLTAAVQEHQQANPANTTNLPIYTTDVLLSDSADGAARSSTELENVNWTSFDELRNAMFIYTSGTTGKPKGVVSTHAGLAAQIQSVVQAWKISNEDRLLHYLPLHHVHGVINALTCLLWSGATVEMLPKFDANAVWQRLRNADNLPPLTLMMGVPTMYSLLLNVMEKDAIEARTACRTIRVMISGSSALSTTVRQRWLDTTGHVLLERYGMTETGMILGGSLDHPEKRVQGCVGWPFPGVEVRLMTENGENGWSRPQMIGEVQVRGPGLFKEYWHRPDATQSAWTSDRWFCTGDTAEWTADGGCRLLGRTSTDIIKSGGYKLSALEIERALVEHPSVQDCAVVGINDPTWGQRVAVCVVLKPTANSITLQELRDYGAVHLARYKLPTLLHVTNELPRNIMSKVDKKRVAMLFETKEEP